MPVPSAAYERSVAALRREVLAAWETMKRAVPVGKIEAALNRGDIPGAVALVPWDRLGPAMAGFATAARGVFESAAAAAAEAVGIVFDAVNPQVFDFVRQSVGTRIAGISVEMREAVRESVRAGFESGAGTRQVAQEIEKNIGLTARQARALDRYRADLLASGVTPAEAGRLADKYRERMIRQRADAIARTEMIDAEAAGRQKAWDQAVGEGVLSKDKYEVRWSTSPNDSCPLCRAMNGMRREVDGGYGNGVARPTRHPNCRCVETLERRGRRAPDVGFYDNLRKFDPVPAELQRT